MKRVVTSLHCNLWLCFAVVLIASLGCYSEKKSASQSEPKRNVTITQLTNTDFDSGQPFWSPEGSQISFVSNRSGSWQIWVINADGTDVRRITRDDQLTHSWPSWHPDGKKIVFYTGTGEDCQTWIFDLETKTKKPLLDSDDQQNDFRPLFSPDSKYILFDRVGPATQGNHDLFKLERSSKALTQLTKNSAYDSDARWSPDGKQIVFHSDRDSEKRFHTQIFVMQADGSNIKQLTNDATRNSYPCWSPDGKRIVYSAKTGEHRALWIINADGSGKRKLTEFEGFNCEPAWSPCGNMIAFVSNRYGKSREIAILHLGSKP